MGHDCRLAVVCEMHATNMPEGTHLSIAQLEGSFAGEQVVVNGWTMTCLHVESWE